MDIYNMYKLLCIIYNDHHLMHCAFCYVKFWKSWLCSSTTATSRKQVTNRLRCRFQSNTYTKVVKASTWKLLYMILMKMHDICFVRFGTGVPELCPFFKIGISIKRKFVSQTSSTVFKSSLKKNMVFLWQSWDRGVYSSQSVIVLYLIDSSG